MAAWPEALAEFLAAKLPAAESVSVRHAGSLPAGASNITVAIDACINCEGTEVVLPLILRPERQDGILGPYDIGRQYRIMRALGPTAVPVPAVAWHEPSGAVLGVPFFLMGRLTGVRTPPLFWYGSSPLVHSAATALAAIHAVDWRAAGLGELLPESARTPLEAELAGWDERARHSGSGRDPALASLREYLLAHEPRDARFSLTHGDTNAGNYLFRGERVAAVVDWELAAIGDPRSDLGFYAALESIFGGYYGDSQSVLAEAYMRVTGTTLEHLDFYEAWGHYRMLVIFSGRWWGPGTSLGRVRELLPGWRWQV
jgi:aminoglycoside phosphotransferase (APT) family kinase protein